MFDPKELPLEGSGGIDTLGINAATQITTQVPGPLHNTSRQIPFVRGGYSIGKGFREHDFQTPKETLDCCEGGCDPRLTHHSSSWNIDHFKGLQSATFMGIYTVLFFEVSLRASNARALPSLNVSPPLTTYILC